MLEKSKTKHIVAPGINWLWATLYEAEAFGYPHTKAEQVGYKKELDVAVAGLREMHRRGIVVLPGGDYGFGKLPAFPFLPFYSPLQQCPDFPGQHGHPTAPTHATSHTSSTS